jgi:hypothetical protein
MMILLKHPLMNLPTWPHPQQYIAAYRSMFATSTDANSRLTKQLEENTEALKESKALLNKERNDRGARNHFAPSIHSYCWTHGYKIARNHISENCIYPKNGHKRESTNNNNKGGGGLKLTMNDW